MGICRSSRFKLEKVPLVGPDSSGCHIARQELDGILSGKEGEPRFVLHRPGRELVRLIVREGDLEPVSHLL
jgi:hypothetical protein